MSDRTADHSAEVIAVETVAGIARDLAAAETLDDTLQRIVDLGVEYIETCESASISFIQGRALSTPVWSDRTAYEADQAQYRHNQGPCLQAIAVHETIVVDDMADERRWPQWREEVLGLELRSSSSFRLFLVSGDEQTYGSLNMYSSRAHAFDGHAQALGTVFASHAAVALKGAITEAGLEQALRSRDVIGLARGILMERRGIGADEALQLLRRTARARKIGVHSLAEQVSESGALPD